MPFNPENEKAKLQNEICARNKNTTFKLLLTFQTLSFVSIKPNNKYIVVYCKTNYCGRHPRYLSIKYNLCTFWTTKSQNKCIRRSLITNCVVTLLLGAHALVSCTT